MWTKSINLEVSIEEEKNKNKIFQHQMNTCIFQWRKKNAIENELDIRKYSNFLFRIRQKIEKSLKFFKKSN